jgi:hypothetical protein
LQLAPEEPEAGPWRAELLSTVIEAITRRGPGNAISGRPVVLAVDGRSNAGKTTLAARICRAVPGAGVVHTDDIAWEHSRFGWADLLIEGILVPVHQRGGRSATARRAGPSTAGKDPSRLPRTALGEQLVPGVLLVPGEAAGTRRVIDPYRACAALAP